MVSMYESAVCLSTLEMLKCEMVNIISKQFYVVTNMSDRINGS